MKGGFKNENKNVLNYRAGQGLAFKEGNFFNDSLGRKKLEFKDRPVREG